MAKLVSKTYGDALFAVASEENRMDEFFEAYISGNYKQILKNKKKQK